MISYEKIYIYIERERERERERKREKERAQSKVILTSGTPVCHKLDLNQKKGCIKSTLNRTRNSLRPM